MSISTALNTAMSGLTAASRASEIVSGNIANAMTEGYARRTLDLATQTWTGPGVRVVGVTRHVDPVLVSDRRGADAGAAAEGTTATFLSRVESLIGTPGDGDSLGDHFNRFEGSLIKAASRPDSEQRLDSVAQDAAAYAAKLNSASTGIQQLRQQADSEIATEVRRLNRALDNVRDLNVQIAARHASGADRATLLDQRQQAVDTINTLIPVRELQREHGQVALMTQSGEMLIDGPPKIFDFVRTATVTPYQTVEAGQLSALETNGRPLSPERLDGGRLAALFDIRDDLGVGYQTQLDAAAADLIQRFEAVSQDGTRSPGDSGLFTDAGNRFDATELTGLAARIALNESADPAMGGESWRLRDGLGAAVSGPEGNATLLNALRQALDDPPPGGTKSAAGVASELMSRAGRDHAEAEERMTLATFRKTELKSAEAALGVDTDAELQNLMTVERAYAANARVIQTVDEMMDLLLGL